MVESSERNPDGEDEDHDLLTFDESGARLSEELTGVQNALAAATDDTERARLQLRVDALTEAVNRNSRIAQHSPGEKGFLEYDPTSGDVPR